MHIRTRVKKYRRVHYGAIIQRILADETPKYSVGRAKLYKS